MLKRSMLMKIARLGVAVTLAAFWQSAAANADDRYLLGQTKSAAAGPYVFVLLDTSGSMTWSPSCTPSDTFDDLDPFDSMCTQECTMDDTTCARICPEGCVNYAIDDPDNPITVLDTIEVDNTAATTSGTWFTSTTFSPFKGTNYSVAAVATAPNFNTLTYEPNITDPGTYQVYMSWIVDNLEDLDTAATEGSYFYTGNVPVSIHHDGGVDKVFIDNRYTEPSGASTEFDGWNLLGTYEMGDTSTGTVVVSNESVGNFTNADNVRWVKIDVPECIEMGYVCRQPICPQGDCYLPLNGDDPNSKFYQAKEAVHEAVGNTEIVHFGFSHYEQNNSRLHSKHWLYRVRAENALGSSYTLPTLGGDAFLEVGDEQVFGNYSTSGDATPVEGDGDGWDCHTDITVSTPDATGATDQQIGCNSSNPIDITDLWEVRRGHRIPKLGHTGSYTTEVWYRVDYDNSDIYKVRYSSAGSSFGDAIFAVNVQPIPCSFGSCGTVPAAVTVYYDLVSDYAAWDNSIRRQSFRPSQQSSPGLQAGYFTLQRNVFAGAGASTDLNDVNSCFGMELNDDTLGTTIPDDEFDDTWSSYNIFWPTVQDPRGDDYDFDGSPDSPRSDLYDDGDMVPIDWEEENVDLVQARLVPNTERAPSALDFRVASYFENSHRTGDPPDPYERRLHLVNDTADGDAFDERPLIAQGLTPLAESVNEFEDWYEEWSQYAPLRDQDFACRNKIVLLVTDGADACSFQPSFGPERGYCKSGSPFSSVCSDRFLFEPAVETGELLDLGVETYVVGFGTDDAELTAMAVAGGTDEPLFARNKTELTEALESVLSRIQSEQRAFASASIPAVQSTAADKVFLSSFTPIPYDPVAPVATNPAPGFWPGRIDAFRKPLPLKLDDTPNTEKPCEDIMSATDNLQSACHLWEAGDVLCEQAQAGTRTVIYGMDNSDLGSTSSGIVGAARPAKARKLEVPEYLSLNPNDTVTTLPAAVYPLVEDLGTVLLDDEVWAAYDAGRLTNGFIETRMLEIIDRTIGIKGVPPDLIGEVDACDLDNDGDDESFVLGDIFHASPSALSGPSNFTYFANDQCGLAQRTDIPSNCASPNALPFGEDRGYRQFAADHVWRRRMLIVPSNDGQLHFFDTGLRQLVNNDVTIADPTDRVELFNDGGGKELFSYVPRLVMPIVKAQAEGVRHVYSMDATVTVADAYIDPIDTLGGQSTVTDRVWRTVLVGGLREAGDLFPIPRVVEGFKSGYFALDVTQPDILGSRSVDTDPTLVPCEVAGCDDTTIPASEFEPSCMTFDSDGNVVDNSNCPFQNNTTTSAAERMPFPAELWSFTDSRLVPNDPATGVLYYLDEDAITENGHGYPDLADTWSRPVIGQVAMCALGGSDCSPGGADLITKHVAIFGGGMDPRSKEPSETAQRRGAYLYFVDIETGQAVYKRRLGDGNGSAPADPAVLDVDRDGVFDVVYIGTTDGFLYKVDLQALDASGDVPGLQNVAIQYEQLLDADGNNPPATGTAFTTQRVTDAAWEPFQILDTGGSPIYHPPSAFFVPERNRYGLALGTGDREDLWSGPVISGEAKFFVILDDNFTAADITPVSPAPACNVELPITEDCVVSFPYTAAPATDFNFLLEPYDSGAMGAPLLPSGVSASRDGAEARPGWMMSIPAVTSGDLESRITTEAFVVAGIIVFSAFDPTTIAAVPPSGDDDDDDDDDLSCVRTGTTRAFVILARNGGPLVDLFDDGTPDPTPLPDGTIPSLPLTAEDRFHEITEFTTAPFIERTATKNDPEDSGKTLLDTIDEELAASVREALLENLPRGSRFNDAFQVVIAALRNSTGVSVYATIPIAIYPADWRDQ